MRLRGITSSPCSNAFGLCPSMGLDDADDDVNSGLPPGVRTLQHLVVLPTPGAAPTKILRRPAWTVLAPGRFQQGFRRGALFGIAALLLSHAVI